MALLGSNKEVSVVVWVVVLVVVDTVVAVLFKMLIDVIVVLVSALYTAIDARTMVSATKKPISAILTFNLGRLSRRKPLKLWILSSRPQQRNRGGLLALRPNHQRDLPPKRRSWCEKSEH